MIGSGIFTVVGTAIAGQKFNTSSILNAPLADYWYITPPRWVVPARDRRWPISLVLVAIVCAFTGLCYAELASMIPIAGSAYTYTYATMGELIAWIIGWDLILEYAVSNMAVSVGFAAHMVATFSWFGWHPALRWITPAYLPGGLTDLQNNVLYAPGWHFGFNIPAFLIVMLLTVVLVRGIRESAETNNVMVHPEDRRHPGLRVRRHAIHSSRQLSSLRAGGLAGGADRRLDHFLHLHRIRLGLDRGRGGAQSATRSANRNYRHADRLYRALHCGGRGADRYRSLADAD